MSGKWSGIGPAVDAHLALWNESGKAKNFYEAVLETNAENARAIANALQVEHVKRWITFGLTYGLVNDDGVAVPAYAALQSTGEITYPDAATIMGREKFQGEEREVYQGALLAKREYSMLSKATSHYVSGEVVDEVTRAAHLAENEPLYDTDLFTPCGFAVLEKPMVCPDIDPETGGPHPTLNVWVRAIGWQRHGGIANLKSQKITDGVSLFLYTTPQDYQEGYVASCLAAGIQVHGFDEHGFPEGDWGNLVFMPMDVIPWAFGAEWTTRDEVGYTPGTVPGPVGYERRWFYAFMRLCWQQIIVSHRPERKRQQHRQWERMAKRKELLDYTVLRLRRVVDPNYVPSGEGTPLDHRVKVRAHWKYQYVWGLGPARLPDGTANPVNHRWIWIESHWRGPEDGPIGAMHSATSVVR